MGAAPIVTSRGCCVSGYEPGGARCGGGGDLNWNQFGGVCGRWERKVLRVTKVLRAVGISPTCFLCRQGSSMKQGCLASSLHQIFSAQCRQKFKFIDSESKLWPEPA